MPDKLKSIQYWVNASKQDFITAKILFDNKRYNHTLFFCHLSIEKLLKAICISTTKHAAPPIHDLVRLAIKSGITLDDAHQELLAEISSFNIAARYDDYKLSFVKKATKVYTANYLKITKAELRWLRKFL